MLLDGWQEPSYFSCHCCLPERQEARTRSQNWELSPGIVGVVHGHPNRCQAKHLPLNHFPSWWILTAITLGLWPPSPTKTWNISTIPQKFPPASHPTSLSYPQSPAPGTCCSVLSPQTSVASSGTVLLGLTSLTQHRGFEIHLYG